MYPGIDQQTKPQLTVTKADKAQVKERMCLKQEEVAHVWKKKE